MGGVETLTCQVEYPDADKEQRDLEKLTMACWIRALTISQAIGEPGEEPLYIGMDWRTCFPLCEIWAIKPMAGTGEGNINLRKALYRYTQTQGKESISSLFSFVSGLSPGIVP